MSFKSLVLNRLLYISLFCFFFVSSIYADTAQEYPVRNIDGKSYYEYTIVQGDGLYGIARRFGIKQSDLHEANPNLDTNIKAGDKILIPIKEDEIMPKAVHVVQPKQTLYGISKLYDISVDSLISMNPDAVNGIRVGETLVLSYTENVEPQTAADRSKSKKQEENLPGTHIVKRKETLYSISKQYGVPIHELIENNPELKDGLKFGTTIIIFPEKVENSAVYQPATDKEPLSVDVIDKVRSVVDSVPAVIHHDAVAVEARTFDVFYADDVISGDTASTVKIVLFLPFMIENNEVRKSSLKFVEFYRGILLALDDMKKAGISVEINTFDTQRSLEVLDSLLKLECLRSADVIIGPAYSNHLEPVLTFAKENNITAVVPFTSKIPEELYFPNLIQFNPSQEYFYKQVSSALVAKYPHKYIIGRFPIADKKGDMFADELKSQLDLNQLSYTEFIVTEQTVDSVIASVNDSTATLLLASSSPIDVNPILETIASRNNPNLSVLGFEEWQTLLSRCRNTIFFSLFCPKATPSYIENYGRWFGEKVQVEEVRYDLLGYDIATMAVATQNNYGEILKTSNPYQQTVPVMEMEDNRLLNVNFYLFRFNGTAFELMNKQ